MHASGFYLLNSRQDVKIMSRTTIFNLTCFYNHAMIQRKQRARNSVGANPSRIDDLSAQAPYLFTVSISDLERRCGNNPSSCILR